MLTPQDLAASAGKLYVARFSNTVVSKIDYDGSVSSYGGSVDHPYSVRFDRGARAIFQQIKSNRVD